MNRQIIIRGAREHNLKNVDLDLPRDQVIVFTGVSGSGKSSLAFDTIFAEGQRRYVESLSAYARQFLGGMKKPDVDKIEGLSPAISIDQKAHGTNPRSTVATLTEIYDYLRVLYARIGEPHCPTCHTRIGKMTTDEMVDHILKYTAENQLNNEAPHNKLRDTSESTSSGILRSSVSIFSTNGTKKNKSVQPTETIIMSPKIRGRKGEYYQMLYDIYNAGFATIRLDGKFKSLKTRLKLSKYQQHTIEIIVDKLVLNGKTDNRTRLAEAVELAVELSDGLCTVLHSDGTEQIFSTEYSCPKCNYSFPEIEPRLFSFNSPYGYCEACTGLGVKEVFSDEICPVCHGKRLNQNALSVFIKNKNIYDLTTLPINETADFINSLKDGKNLNQEKLKIAEGVLREILNRLQFMLDVGLHYLTLNRTVGTLSGGESQRIRLASQIGTKLVGALYVLDEPTIGLHQKDNERLIDTLVALKDSGNTIILVEHDEDAILASDWVVDLGPGAGVHGGKIVASEPTSDFLKNKTSLTAKYLRGDEKITVPETRRKVNKDIPQLRVKNCQEHNLKNISVNIPLRRFVCITGVSGSGKSTLMKDIVYQAIYNRLNLAKHTVGKHGSITGIEYLDKCLLVDQSPIGRTSRSNPATYTKVFDEIRDLFAATVEARVKGYTKSRFSFNVPGGRCEHCEGKGTLSIEMHFLPDVEIPCAVCRGKRFDKETLGVYYKKKNISDILNMTIEEGTEFFRDIPQIYDKLKILSDVGLEYLTLGQSATTLSGGEAQRIKLARELTKHDTTKTFYLLDEPTIGLHWEDIKKLIKVLDLLVQKGNTVVVIEHNLEIIKQADWIIDLGPEGGDKGGEIIAEGTPEEISYKKGSYTGQYLKPKLLSH